MNKTKILHTFEVYIVVMHTSSFIRFPMAEIHVNEKVAHLKVRNILIDTSLSLSFSMGKIHDI